ncbi:hypothetical protein Tco_1430622, partial [Tanacetum coccineum]
MSIILLVVFGLGHRLRAEKYFAKECDAPVDFEEARAPFGGVTRVIEDNPESHSGSMSSMKNLKDTDNFGDQFLYDKPTEDDQEKSKVVHESDSTIPDPSHQTVTSPPPVIT